MKKPSQRAAPRLKFTDEDMDVPALKKPVRRMQKAADRLDAAQAKIPLKKKMVREKAIDAATGKQYTQIRFEEMHRKPPDTLHHPVAKTVSAQLHRQIDNHEEGNSGLEAAHGMEKAGESALRMGKRAHHAHQLKQHRGLAKAEKQLDKSNRRLMQEKHAQKNPNLTSNPMTRWQQKRSIRKEYAKAKTSGNVYHATDGARKAARTSTKATEKIAQFFRRGGKRSLTLVGLGLMMVLVMNTVSSFVPLIQTGINAFAIGTYPAMEEDVLAAEQAYRNMENELQDKLDHYESRHPGYDEYRYELQEIWHDPYALIAIISAYGGGEEWTIDNAFPILIKYFELQYILTETVESETRYREETRTGYNSVEDPTTGEAKWVPYEYQAQVPYTYTICTVKLVNKNLSHLPVYTMSRTNLGLYALYMSTLGNMPDLFWGNPYASELKDPLLYDVPEETLAADAHFAALIAEAELYLGYPYVWGGDSPETSFDCSGFVSWVFTNSGVYDTGRLGATGLYGICQTITPDEAKPGDLIFFEGTLGEGVEGNDGITHVGIYVGNNMMIHCGNPISYADLSRSYWQEHFYAYGRVPY